MVQGSNPSYSVESRRLKDRPGQVSKILAQDKTKPGVVANTFNPTLSAWMWRQENL